MAVALHTNLNPRMRSTLKTTAAITLTAMLTACMAVGKIAYDEAANRERRDCDRLVSMSDRQACLQRVNAAAKQAETERKKP